MKTYTKQDFHNPEQLTRQQVGEEYRLLLPSELDPEYGNVKNVELFNSIEAWSCGNGSCSRFTYRFPLATPLPDGTVLSSNECCWSDELHSSDGGFCTSAIAMNKVMCAFMDNPPRIKYRKRIYVAGAMSSHPEDFNFPSFFKASKELERQGYDPVNPAQLDIDAGYSLERLKALTPDEFQVFLKGAMKRDLDALQQCDAIALLPGWENSKGAKAEKAVAEWLGLEVMYLDGAEAPNEPEEAWEESRYECGNAGKEDWDVTGLKLKLQATEFEPDDPKGAAGALKAPMWLLPPYALQQTAWVHKLGAEKYGDYNWRKTSVCSTTYISAMMRHLDAWRDGEDNDPESGVSHIAHVAASCNIILDAQHCDKLRDDRPKLRQI